MRSGREVAREVSSAAMREVRAVAEAFLHAHGDASGWEVARARDLVELCSAGWRSPASLLDLRIARECVAELHGLALETGAMPLAPIAGAHDALDTAVSVSGGVADLLDDEHDWSSTPDETRVDAPSFLLPGLEAMLPMSRDLLDRLRVSGTPSTSTRDAERAVRLGLGLRSLARSPDGLPRELGCQAAREASEAIARVRETLEAIGDPEGLSAVAAYVQDGFSEAESGLSQRISPTP